MASRQIQVLLLEDQSNERLLLRSLLTFTEAFRADVTEASTAAEAERLLASRRFDVVFLSADLQGGNGLRWLPELVAGGFAPVIVLARDSSERLAVAAIKAGAFDYYPKSQVSAQVLSDILLEAVQATDQNGVFPGIGSVPGVVGQPLSLDRIRAFGGPGSGPGSGGAATRPRSQSPGEVPFRPTAPPAPGRQTGPSATALTGSGVSSPRPSPPEPGTGGKAPSTIPAVADAATSVAEDAVAQNVQNADNAQTPANRAVAEAAPAQESRELAYRTTGIDRAMESFGLHRAPTLVESLPQLWTDLEKVLHRIAAKPVSEQYAEIQDMAKRTAEMIRKDFEIVPVLQTRYPGEKLIVGHSVNTAMLCIVLSRYCEYAQEETSILASAALLHDIAEFRSAPPEAAGRGEKAQFATETARSIGAPETVVQALQQYLEHADGSGPQGLKAREIVIDAQVLLLADCFEHIYHQRWDRFAGTPLASLAQEETARGTVDPINLIVHDLRSWFQPRVLKALIFTAGFYSTGSIVELNNGAVARVVSQNRNKPTLPVVEVISTSLGEKPPKPLRLDLAETRGIAIRKTLSYNPPSNV